MMMNKITLFIFLLFGLGLQSCDNLNEEIHVHEDGSGTYEIYTDMVPGVVRMGTRMKMMFDSTATEPSQAEIDEMLDKQFWNDMPSTGIDSIMDMREGIPDSILAMPGVQKFIESSEMYMKGSKELGYLYRGIRIEFEDCEDLNDKIKTMDDMMNSDNESSMPGGNIDMEFAFDNGVFSRQVVFPKNKNGESDDKGMAMLDMMMGEGVFKSTITFDKKIKNPKSSFLKESTKNSAVFEYPMIEYLMGKLDADVRIETK